MLKMQRLVKPVPKMPRRDESSVLDLVMEDAKALQRRASAADKVKIDEYFESVRSVEQRMAAALRPQKRWINSGKYMVERPGPGIPAAHAEHVRLMLDILVLAFWTEDDRRHQFKLFKPAEDVVPDDLPFAWLKDALVSNGEDECC